MSPRDRPYETRASRNRRVRTERGNGGGWGAQTSGRASRSGGALRWRPARPARRRRGGKASRWWRSGSRPRPRMRFGGPQTMAWGAVSLLWGTGMLLLQTTAFVIAFVASLAVTGIVGAVEQRQARSTAPAPPRRRSNPAPGTRSGPQRRSGSTRPRKPGGATCSARCRRSRKPKKDCECKATPCLHGTESGAAT